MSGSSADYSSSHTSVSFEIKSAQLPLVSLILKTADWAVLAPDLLHQFGPEGDNPDFFDHDALVIDFSQLPIGTTLSALAPLLALLRSCQLVPVAVRGAQADCVAEALTLGLVEAPLESPRLRVSVPPPPPSEVVVYEVVKEVEVIREVTHERPALGTMVIEKPLRSGQKVYARGADLVVLAMVNQGAEVVADGNIHVYAALRGKAMAGASGNTNARIFSLCLEPELISIAGVYRTSENPLAPEVRGKPAQVRLSNDGQEKLLFEALKP